MFFSIDTLEEANMKSYGQKIFAIYGVHIAFYDQLMSDSNLSK